jgi:hypothetical protein
MRNMLEHQITVLENVSDNVDLFKKEIEKSAKWLNENDFTELKEWVVSNYPFIYETTLEEMFTVH